MWFDPIYFLFALPGMLLAMYAQYKVKSAFHRGSQIRARCGLSGAEVADLVMRNAGVTDVGIEPVGGQLSDHYSPGEKMLRLSEPVYGERTLSAIGVAAHEAGHALQDARGYPMLVIRNAIVPLAALGGNVSYLLIILGFMLQISGLLWVGIGAFSLTVLFQLINLPVEFDASARARKMLQAEGLVTAAEDEEVGKVLNAAALTYVAATLTSILILLYYLYRAGVFNRR